MCFSATASFTASAVLVGAGSIALAVVRRPGQRPFAAVPLLFAVQQFVEGWIWLGLSDAASAVPVASLSRGFLFFSQVLWPVWVPAALWWAEAEARRRTSLALTLGAGAVVSLFFAWHLITAVPAATLSGHHIRYTFDTPAPTDLAIALLYGTATVVPCFLSSQRRMWALGIALILSYGFTRLTFPGTVISVWCYFAALISAVIIHLLMVSRNAIPHDPRTDLPS